MIIYEFSTWFTNGAAFNVREIEVEEKPKTYVGKGFRINKSDIDKFSGVCGNRMYRLDNDPKPYIQAMIERRERSVQGAEKRLAEEKAELEKWRAVAERDQS
jgi:hypothetical protein